MLTNNSNQSKSNARVIVGMSGGVDSSVAALLLKNQGYHVEGLFMKNWEEDDTDTHCSASIDVADARAVCDKLNISMHTVNFAAEYWDSVFENFLEEYRAGRTPNPDILCNKEIKFKAFLDYATTLGADFIATGHYARNYFDGHKYHLLKGVDVNKDQSYFLYTLGQDQLAKSLFPVGELSKPEVRRIATEAGFSNHAKKDSTGICFIGERKFRQFLSTYLPVQPGQIKTLAGKIIGTHDGLMYYTIGQRQGLGIGGLKGASEEPWYVLAKNLEQNVLIVGQGHQHPWLFSKKLTCCKIHWVARELPAASFHCAAKTRYRQVEQPCYVKMLNDNECEVELLTPQWAVTPGQSIVFYHNDDCLGGGIIEQTWRA